MAYTIQDASANEVNYHARSLTFTKRINECGTFRFSETLEGGASGCIGFADNSEMGYTDGTCIGYAGTDYAAALQVGSDVYVYDGATKVFGGIVEQASEIDLTEGTASQRRITYSGSCFNRVPRRRLAAVSYTDTKAGTIVNSLLTTYLASEGITAGTIADGPVFAKTVFNYVTVASALDELSEMTGYKWMVDGDRQLHFTERSATAAPTSITNTSRPYRKISVHRARPQYRNTQWVRGGEDLTDTIVRTFAGDGETQSFLTDYPVGEITSVEVDTGSGYTTQTFGVRSVDSGKDWYYQVGSHAISQDDGGTTLTSAHTLRVTYRGRIPIIIKVEDTAEQTARAAIETGSGEYEAVMDLPDVDSTDLAFDRANGALARYGAVGTTVKMTLDAASGFDPGDLFAVTLSQHDLSGSYLVTEVAVRDRGDDELEYTVTATSNDQYDGGWVAFFRKLAQSGKRFAIRDNEVLMLLRTPADDATASDSLGHVVSSPSTPTVNGAGTFGLIEVG